MRKLRERRDLALLAAANGLSAVGDLLAFVALFLRVHEETGSGYAVSGVLLGHMVAYVIFAPVGGLLADRFETVRVLAVAATLQGLAAVALAFAGPLWLVIALIAAIGMGQAVTQPAEFALTPLAAGRSASLATANAWVETARYAGWTVGPLLAGVLTSFGFEVPLLVDAGTFFALALLALALRVRRPPQLAAEQESRVSQALDGIRTVMADRVAGLVMAVVGVFVLVVGVVNVAEVFFAKDVLGVSDFGFGLMVAAWTVGMVVGASLLAPRLPAVEAGGFVIGAAMVMGVAIAAYSFADSLVPALAALVLGGVANGVEGVGWRTLIHGRVHESRHARAGAAYNAVVNIADLAATGMAGPLIAALGSEVLLRAGGLGALGVGAIGLLLYLRLPPATRRPSALPIAGHQASG